ncbi:GM22607 [Drosophila sechellia]|uniref:GM22607 n=1 Tax=Drosophila sechellia TaxID=7238 RepID=B4IN08_DROSE|nr:GM22607 [Drosophila sechellia]
MVKKDEKEKILISEKASSFKFHPGRLCEDQCYYCSGKCGLYDTPCDVGQIKSVERQQKILANEEKLTVDNCLCDACFRHVDRRANVPSYKKRLSAPGHLEMGSAAGSTLQKQFAGDSGVITEAGGEAGSTAAVAVQQRSCGVKDCVEAARHTLRRKCIRKRVKKYQLSLEIPAGSSNVGLCEGHYNTVIQFSGCVLCKRRLGKNHMYNITTQDTIRLEKALSEMGIPVQLGMGTAVCKLCRYFANLLIKPPDSTKAQKAEFVKNYRKRLLKVHNLQDGSHELSEADEEDAPNATEAERPTSDGHEDTEMPMVADYDGPTDSNSSSSSTAALDTSKQMSKLQAILQQNEELGVQFKVPFGCSSSQRTPEGWTRVQTFLQYDEPTRRLWEELQKPYGNQSSFLRHLILLEKYYRNGDLVLAPHASSNATVYTETVRQRLNSFDHGHCGGFSMAGSPSSSGSGKRSGVPQPTGASVLATALITPLTSHSSSSASISSEQQASVDPVIPLVELNDDDEGEDGAGGAGERELTNRQEDTILESLSTASVDKLTKQLSSNAVTIIARPKDKSQLSCKSGSSTSISSSSSAISSPEEVAVTKVTAVAPVQSKDAPPLAPASSGVSNSRSILKTNLLGMNKAVELVPLTTAPHAYKPTGCHKPEKQQKISDAANKQLGSQGEPVPPSALLGLQSKLKPPMQQQQVVGSGAGTTSGPQKPSNVAQLLSSPPELISLHRRQTSGAAAGASSFSSGQEASTSTIWSRASGAGTGTGAGAAGSRSAGGPPPPNVVILPDALTAQERHESKSWKPTLIPLEDQHKVPNKSHALYQTADGRRLPALVQVQSGGKPYLISIFDYNRMCILRREKLMRDQLLKTNAKPKPQNQQQQQGQTHQQQQNSAASAAAFSNMVKLAQQHTARQQLQQLQQKPQQQQQLPTLQPGGVRLARMTQKLLMPPLTNPQIGSQAPNLQPLLSSTLDNSNSCWLWKNFPDPNQYLLNGNGAGAGGSSSKLPHLTAKPATATSSSGAANKSAGSLFTLKQQQHQQKLIDNAIMSKIPKSLTVIPQQMGGNTGGDMGGSSSSGKD